MVYAHLREINDSLLGKKDKSQGSAVSAVNHEAARTGILILWVDILIEFIRAQNNWLE